MSRSRCLQLSGQPVRSTSRNCRSCCSFRQVNSAGRNGAPSALASVAGVAISTIAIWAYWNAHNVAFATQIQGRLDIHQADNLRLAVTEPLTFWLTILRTVVWRSVEYATGFVGLFGWASIFVSKWVLILYGAMLLAAVYARSGSVCFRPWQRALLVFVFGAGALITIVLLWIGGISQSELAQIAAHHWRTMDGIQGRYFIPAAPLLLVALSSRRFRISGRAATVAAIATVLVSNGASLRLIAHKFYANAQAESPRVLELNGPDRIGVYRNGEWILDRNGNRWRDLSDVTSTPRTAEDSARCSRNGRLDR